MKKILQSSLLLLLPFAPAINASPNDFGDSSGSETELKKTSETKKTGKYTFTVSNTIAPLIVGCAIMGCLVFSENNKMLAPFDPKSLSYFTIVGGVLLHAVVSAGIGYWYDTSCSEEDSSKYSDWKGVAKCQILPAILSVGLSAIQLVWLASDVAFKGKGPKAMWYALYGLFCDKDIQEVVTGKTDGSAIMSGGGFVKGLGCVVAIAVAYWAISVGVVYIASLMVPKKKEEVKTGDEAEPEEAKYGGYKEAKNEKEEEEAEEEPEIRHIEEA